MGWDPVFLQDAVNTCTNPSGQIEDCPLFNIQTEYPVCNITLPSALENENVVGGISNLPGNVPIVSGPAPASGATAGSPVTGAPPAPSSVGSQVVPTLSYSAGSSLASLLSRSQRRILPRHPPSHKLQWLLPQTPSPSSVPSTPLKVGTCSRSSGSRRPSPSPPLRLPPSWSPVGSAISTDIYIKMSIRCLGH
jgi:hypothetical protein